MINGVKAISYRNAEKFIRELMLMRRTLELLGIDIDEYDQKLQEWTEQYFKEFSEMSQADLMLIMEASTKGGVR